jgi:hypothetical protein
LKTRFAINLFTTPSDPSFSNNSQRPECRGFTATIASDIVSLARIQAGNSSRSRNGAVGNVEVKTRKYHWRSFINPVRMEPHDTIEAQSSSSSSRIISDIIFLAVCRNLKMVRVTKP